MTHHWIAEAITAGLEKLDVDEALEQIAKHVTTKGEWEKGVVSPSLVARSCHLQRLKTYLGHAPRPGQPVHMAGKAGIPDAISLINMTRGFLAEGLLLTALIAEIGDRVIAHAPTYAPRYEDPQTHIVYAGHPDALIVDDDGSPALVQIKCPSVYKYERVMKLGDADALETYQAQMATELFIVRNTSSTDIVSMNVARNHLLLFAWEHTGKDTRPRIHVTTLPWHESLATIPATAGDELVEQEVGALAQGIWPEAYPEHQWNTWPCAYCPFSRLGDYTDKDNVLPKCDDHAAWEK